MSLDKKINRAQSRVLGSLTILVAGIFSFFLIYEWITVNEFNSAYPFGAEGPMPYYYASAGSYLKHVFVFGLLFLTIFSTGLYGLLKDKRVLVLYTFVTMIIVFVVMLLLANKNVAVTDMSTHLRGSRSRGYYTMPYDSTMGVPSFVFIITWIFILLFLVRLAWEYRDKIFVKKEEPERKREVRGKMDSKR